MMNSVIKRGDKVHKLGNKIDLFEVLETISCTEIYREINEFLFNFDENGAARHKMNDMNDMFPPPNESFVAIDDGEGMYEVFFASELEKI